MILNINPVKHEPCNCKESLLINICKYFGVDYKLLFSCTWNFAYWQSNESIPFCYTFSAASNPLLQDEILRKFYGIDITEMKVDNFNELIKTIISSISKSKPVGICCDSYFYPWNPLYRKEHIGHYCLVIGLDVSKKLIYCIDSYFSFDDIFEMSFDDLSKGIKTYLTFNKHVVLINELDLLHFYKLMLINTIGMFQNNQFNRMREFAESFNKMNAHTNVFGNKNSDLQYLFRNINEIEYSRNNFISSLKYIDFGVYAESISSIVSNLKLVNLKWRRVLVYLTRLNENFQVNILNDISKKIVEISHEEERIAFEIFSIINNIIHVT